MEKFTAAQARELMPDRFDEMVGRIHSYIREAALAGKVSVIVTFCDDLNNNGCVYKVKDFLEKDEGYSVILSVKETSFSFYINWRES